METKKISLAVSEPASDNLRKLIALFPSIMKDGQVDLEALKAELGIFDEPGKDRYELTWAGKQEARKIAAEPVFGRTLKYAPEESKKPEATENLYIEGDNLEVLKLLQNSYMGKIKMIYIDPPYNTGNDFIYNDDFRISAADSAIAEGNMSENRERYTINTNSDSRYHARWLSMMYPRLRLAKNLLRDDGVIFVSIDDNEVHNLRHIMDDIFGEDNFVADIIWKKRGGPPNDQIIGNVHEYILTYTKNFNCINLNLKERTDAQLERYKNPDNHPKGRWASDNLMANVKGGRYVASLYYPIKNPVTGVEHYPSSNGNWRFNKEKMQELLDNNEIYFGKDNLGRPKLKRFLCDVKEGVPFSTLFDYIPYNNTATNEMKEFIGSVNIFDTPKPMALIEELSKLGSSFDSIILDFFSGSATTAHAVMQLNAEDDGNRKFIMVQLPEVCPPDSEAARAGYKTISDIGKERIRRAGDKILAESGKEIDIGFKVFKTADTNIRWIAQENGVQISQTHLDDTAKSVLDRRDFMPDATDIDVAYEILLRQWDIPLSATMETLTDIGQRTYCFADTVVVCLEEEVTREIVDKIASIEPMPHKVIFRDSAFGTNISLKLNTMERFDAMMKRHGEKTKQAYTVEFL